MQAPPTTLGKHMHKKNELTSVTGGVFVHHANDQANAIDAHSLEPRLMVVRRSQPAARRLNNVIARSHQDLRPTVAMNLSSPGTCGSP